MRILYWGNVNDTLHTTIDAKVLEALKEVADVKFLDIKEFSAEQVVKESKNSDLFLFHAQIPTSDDVEMMLMIEQIQAVLQKIECKKALWFMEKVWLGKGAVIEGILPLVDYAFLTDDTWVRRMNEKIYPLSQASPIKPLVGEFKKELQCDIAYVGNIYGIREQEYQFLHEKFGLGIKFFQDKFGQDLANLCQSAKIMIIPRFPFDDFYWSERIYEYLSMGAFVIQQRTYGLKEEGFEDGKHYIEYESDKDLIPLVESMLSKEGEEARKGIALAGKDFVKNYTYRERIKEMLKIIQNETKS